MPRSSDNHRGPPKRANSIAATVMVLLTPYSHYLQRPVGVFSEFCPANLGKLI